MRKPVLGGDGVQVESGRVRGVGAFEDDAAAATADVKHVAIGHIEGLIVDRDPAGAADIDHAHLAV